MSEVQKHKLTWGEGEVPVSERFADAFYSRSDGRAEAEHVFLGGNDLPRRFSGRNQFTIAELGFGTGLNFVETWRQWIEARQPGQRLTFVSFEGFPMDAEDMARALARWPEISPLASRLVEAWGETERAEGSVCRFSFDEQTELCVSIGAADRTLPRWEGFADAWYLDGFAPSRNADMWGGELMREVFLRTAPGGSFATYSAAGWVRRNLLAAGFAVEKCRGFAGKREMMRGVKPVAGELS